MRSGQNLVPLQIRDKIQGIISLKVKQLVSNVLLLQLVTNSKKKSLFTTNINSKLGDSVAEVTVSEPTCHFQHWHGKIQEHLQTPQKTPNEEKVENSKK